MPSRKTRDTRFSARRQPKRYGGAVNLKGSDNFASKLTEKIVERARSAHKKGATVTELADRYGVNKSTMSRALRKQTYRHVR
jgi:DNA invertase Pin-like site-specific DNA recombinase